MSETPTKLEKENISEIMGKISEYLQNGGLFNPEHMDHQQVRDLLMEARQQLAAAQATLQEIRTLAYKFLAPHNSGAGRFREKILNLIEHNKKEAK